MRQFKRVCVYCGSSNHVDARYFDAARTMGRTLAERGVGVVYGGGRVGLMGALADAALAAGGHVTGVIPDRLMDHELGHTGVSELLVVPSMHSRKMLMAALSDAFVALPGGWGTMEELFEVTTWTQLELHRKPVGMLNVDGYYDPMLAWVERAAAERFIRPLHRELVIADTDPARLLDRLAGVELPGVAEWIDDP
jgi:uncharacterized protein (TIGR00730 family)